MYIARYYRRLQEVFDHTMRTKVIDPALSADQVKTEVSNGDARMFRESGMLNYVCSLQAQSQFSNFEPEIDPLAFEQFW